MKWARIWNAATFGRITGNSNAREAGLREVIQIAPRRWRPRARHDKVEVNAHLMVYAKG